MQNLERQKIEKKPLKIKKITQEDSIIWRQYLKNLKVEKSPWMISIRIIALLFREIA